MNDFVKEVVLNSKTWSTVRINVGVYFETLYQEKLDGIVLILNDGILQMDYPMCASPRKSVEF